MMKKPMMPREALERLRTLCNASEQCSTDLIAKLRRWQISTANSEKIMRYLHENRLVDDARFCGAYARDKMRYSRWGRLKIRAMLAAKHLDRDAIADALDALEKDEYRESARRAILAFAARFERPLDYNERLKTLRHAVGRGFESALVTDIMKTEGLWDS